MSYLKKVLALGLQLKRGRLYVVAVQHDSWCAIWRGDCDCDPDLTVAEDDVVDLTP